METTKPDFIAKSGAFIFYEYPWDSDIRLDDIIFNLSNINRYCGGTEWSVLQHSLLVYYLLLEKFTKQDKTSRLTRTRGLLHDGSEAYMSDIPSGLKKYLPDYKKIEAEFEEAIYGHIIPQDLLAASQGFGNEIHTNVKKADIRAYEIESSFLSLSCKPKEIRLISFEVDKFRELERSNKDNLRKEFKENLYKEIWGEYGSF